MVVEWLYNCCIMVVQRSFDGVVMFSLLLPGDSVNHASGTLTTLCRKFLGVTIQIGWDTCMLRSCHSKH